MADVDIMTLDRPVQLHIIADWGDANLHRVAGWMSRGLIERAPPRTRTVIWSGVGGFDAAFAVGRGEVDIGIATPSSWVDMAARGFGPFAEEPFPGLRGIANIPQDDRLLVAIRASLGFDSFASIRAARPALRIALSADDGALHYGFAAYRLLEAHGLDRATLESWGGRFIEADRPDECLAIVRNGDADMIIHEAMMAPYWHEAMASEAFVFPAFERDAVDLLVRDFGMRPGILPAGYFPGQAQSVDVLDFSDFLVFARDDMPDDLAHLLAALMVERRPALERGYRHLPRDRSPITYPLDPRAMAETIIPLHPGAARYYRGIGALA